MTFNFSYLSVAALCFFTASVKSQSHNASEIIFLHLNATSKKPWQELQTIIEHGKTIYPDSSIVSWEKLKSGSQKSILSFIDNGKHKIVGENEQQIWRLVNNELVKTPKLFSSALSKFNYSFALSRADFENSSLFYLRDTTISNSKYHIIQFNEENDMDIRFIFINDKTYRLEFIEFKGRFPEWIQFTDFRWVDGYLFPFAEISYIKKDLKYETSISYIKINSPIESRIFECEGCSAH